MGDKKQIRTYLDSLYCLNYKETPVDIITFISDPTYLGKSTDGGKAIYPYWKDALHRIFSDNTKLLIVLTGAIGTGKSSISLYSLSYIMYRLLLLREPWKYFNLADAGKMAVSFFNLNKTLGESRGYNKLQSFITKSPWFKAQASYIAKSRDLEFLEFSILHFILSSPHAQGFGVLGEDVVSGVMDEVDSPNAPLTHKEKVVEVYKSTVRRFKDRFAPKGYSLGKLFLVASKQGENSFIDNFIETMRDQNEVLVFDTSLWDAKPIKRSGVFFPVAVGDTFKVCKIAPLLSQVPESSKLREFGYVHRDTFNTFKTEVLKEGYSKIIDVPIEFRFDFEKDVVGSLRDLAGITVAGLRRRKLIASEKFITECFAFDKKNPVNQEEIIVGLGDFFDLIEFLDISKFRLNINVVRFIHLDMSISGDAYGLAMSGIKEWVEGEVQQEEGTFMKTSLPLIETDFVMKLKAREGDRIPLDKVRKLILDLRRRGINIGLVTADLVLLSEDTRQILTKAGIKTDNLSLDKTTRPYLDFRNLIYERRWVCHFNQKLLTELSNLEESAEGGKIDHPKEMVETVFLQDGSVKSQMVLGTKDLADAVAGSVYSCLMHNKAPINMDIMRETFKKINAVSTNKEEKIDIPLKDSSGKKIVGVKEGQTVRTMIDIMKQMRRR